MAGKVAKGIGVGAAVVAAAALAARLASGGRSGRTEPGEAYLRALADTEERAAALDGPDGAAVRAGLDRFTAMFAAFDRTQLAAEAARVYAADAYFNDQVKVLRGSASIGPYLARSAAMLTSWSITMDEPLVDGSDVYLRWVMRYQTDPAGAEAVAPGISHLRFDREGKVLVHHDLWDATAGIFERIPVLGGMIRLVKSRI